MPLVGYWSFDGDALDRSGYGNHGTLINNPSFVTGLKNKAISLNGSTQYITVSEFDVRSAFTISAFGKRLDGQPSGDYAGIICNLTGDSNTGRFLIKSNQILMQFKINTVSINHLKTGLNIDTNYHNFVVTYDGARVKMYLDALNIYDQPQTGILDSGVQDTTIGWGSTVSNFYHWNGELDEVRIYNHALSQKEITSLYQNGLNKLLGITQAQMLRAKARTNFLRSKAMAQMLRSKTKVALLG